MHQCRDINPERVALHLERLEERKRLSIEMEAQASERRSVAVEEFRHLTANDAVECRHTLLAIEQQFHNTRGNRSVTAMICRLGLCRPYQQPSDGVPAVEGIKQPAHLIAVPHVTALELRQGVPAINVIKNRRNLHSSPYKALLATASSASSRLMVKLSSTRRFI